MTRTTWSAAFALVFLGACGGPQVAANEDMTADEHEAEADREEAAADRHEEMYDPDAREREEGGGVLPVANYELRDYNPTEGHLAEAEEHRAHAAEHRAMAEYLRAYEEHECARFPEQSRTSCPFFLGLESIEDVEGGVRLQFAEDAQVEAVADHIRCHLAFAAANGTEGMEHCAVYVPGAMLTVEEGAIELTTGRGDEEVAELRRRVRVQEP